MNRPTRRRILKLGAGALSGATAVGFGRSGARADAAIESHGLSAFGDLAYPPDFAHFSYVNPQAPKGGIFSQIGPDQIYNQNFLTFNSLNTFILKGDAAQGMELTFASLMVRSGDEPDAMYGLAAAKVRRSTDGLTYQFVIRPEAKFHDGSPLTAHDVAFSLATLKEKGHPLIGQSLRDFAGATADDDATVTVRFAPKRARDVPLFVAGLPIFSRAYYATRPFDESSLDIPLGSGAYQVGRFEPGRFIEYNRVKDWWGADLPVGRGQSNFDVVRFEYYRDRDVGFEGFSAGTYLFREEFTSRFWATRYDFPAAKDGRVKRDEIPDDTPSGAQGWFINTRRPQFADVRLRDALNDAFDFEWTNKTIMYNAYLRTVSVFQNSDMMATGVPSAAELELLEPFRNRLPADVFGEPYTPPVSDGSGEDRPLLRRAAQTLARCRLRHPRWQALAAERRAHHRRIFDRRAGVRAAPYAVHQKSRHTRHRSHASRRRSGAIPGAPRQFRLRYYHRPVQLFGDAGRLAAFVFFLAGSGAARFEQSCRHRRSGGRRADRGHYCRRFAARAGDGRPRARPGHPRRPLLDSELVQGVALDRLLGRVRPAAGATALFSRYSRHLVV